MLNILYRDDYLAAVDKPPGLLVHRTGLDAGETRFAVQLLRDQIGQPSGRCTGSTRAPAACCCSRWTPPPRARSACAFESGEAMRKTYHAVVRGWPADEGLIDHPLKRMPDDMRTERERCRTRRRGSARWSATSCRWPTAAFPPRAAPWSSCNP
jgi:tRNA pseudouridine65 synthase